MNVKKDLKGKFKNMKHPVSLKSYSMWLADFDGMEAAQELEMPGQYEGWAKPQPERHVKVIRILPDVLTLSSKCKPKRIKIIGSDRKEYPFLIKVRPKFIQIRQIYLKGRYYSEKLRIS